MDRDIRRTLARKYNGMKQRCYNPKNSEYKNYGARGIGICEEWLSNEKTVWAFHESASLWREVRTHGRWVSMLHNFGHEAVEYG